MTAMAGVNRLGRRPTSAQLKNAPSKQSRRLAVEQMVCIPFYLGPFLTTYFNVLRKVASNVSNNSSEPPCRARRLWQ
jgi:hypothetical protein